MADEADRGAARSEADGTHVDESPVIPCRGRKPKKRPGYVARVPCSIALAEKVARDIKRGSSIHAACGARGIPHTTLDQWIEQGFQEGSAEPYATFARILTDAREYAVAVAERRVYAGKGAWCSSARWLESMRPDPWRRTERREVGAAGEFGRLLGSLADANDAELERIRHATGGKGKRGA